MAERYHTGSGPGLCDDERTGAEDSPVAGRAEVAGRLEGVRHAGRDGGVEQAQPVGDEQLVAGAVVSVEVDRERVEVGGVDADVARGVEVPGVGPGDVLQTHDVALVRVTERGDLDVVAV